MLYHGHCHCGAVKFEVEAPAELESHECNCSICRMTGFLHLIVPRDDFRLLAGDSDLTTYTFNTRLARHLFCKHCGIKSFYVPRSNPDGVSVNIRCLDPFPENVKITSFDGQNWEQHAHTLHHLSQSRQEGKQ